MTVLHVISSGGFYGAENVVLNLMQAQQRIGCSPVLASFVNQHRPNTSLADLAVERGLRVELIRCQGRLDLLGARRLRDCIHKIQPQIIHSHGYKANLYSYFASRGSELPLVATCHGWTSANATLQWYERLDRFVLRRFQKVVTVSGRLTEILARTIPSERLRYISNGVPTERFDVLRAIHDRTACTIGMVGRLTPAKGFMDVLRSVPEILANFPAAKFVIFGDGPEAARLQAAARDGGFAGKVSFRGHCSDSDAIYSAMDIFVLPSYLEAMPMTVLEAMAADIPVVATHVGTIPELLGHGNNGILIQPGDRTALVRAICSLMEDSSLRRKFAKEGHEVVARKYSAARMAEKYLDVYSEVVPNLRAAACMSQYA